ncbi:MAG: (d)CMP kinase [Lentisphaeria bacterium]|nr:(d)CMP kinase [Lentisphaeria bacterium]
MSANVIAIDGPAASGKSSVAKIIAERLRIPYISTGALYRALAWKWKQLGHSIDEMTALPMTEFLASTKLACKCAPEGGLFEAEIDGKCPGAELHTQEISAGASRIATMPEVRTWLLDVQRDMAGERRIVMEGRDIGTAIFPDALHKFFLTASPEVRAERRLKQSGEPFDDAALKRVAAEIAARDEQDRTRKTAPLKQAEDAVFLDNSSLDLEQTVQFILDAVRKKDIETSRATVLRYRVPYADTDQMGVVYYANYLKYFEMFRTEVMIAAGESYQQMEEHGYALPVIEAVCHYKSPARFEDMLEITGRVAECRGVRVRIECEIHCRGKLLAEGHTIHACINREGKPVRVPPAISDLLAEKK